MAHRANPSPARQAAPSTTPRVERSGRPHPAERRSRRRRRARRADHSMAPPTLPRHPSREGPCRSPASPCLTDLSARAARGRSADRRAYSSPPPALAWLQARAPRQARRVAIRAARSPADRGRPWPFDAAAAAARARADARVRQPRRADPPRRGPRDAPVDRQRPPAASIRNAVVGFGAAAAVAAARPPRAGLPRSRARAGSACPWSASSVARSAHGRPPAAGDPTG
jgi:hypothetical protein